MLEMIEFEYLWNPYLNHTLSSINFKLHSKKDGASSIYKLPSRRIIKNGFWNFANA